MEMSEDAILLEMLKTYNWLKENIHKLVTNLAYSN